MAAITAYSYPLLSVFLTTLWIVGFIFWIWLVIAVFADIFRSHDMSGWSKALWVLAVLILPFIGVLMYLIVRGTRMRERAVDAAAEQEEANREYIRSVAGTGPTSGADDLAKLARLRDQGVISQQEFDQQKARILSRAS